MIVRVKLFAVAKQLAGRGELEVELPDGSKVVDLRAAIVEQFPALRDVLRHALIAVNTQYAANDLPIPQDAEVACIPPVSGG